MDVPRALHAELAVLTEALADPGVNLQQQVQRLADSIRGAVSSCLGLRVTIVVDGNPFTVTVLDDAVEPVAVGASVAITLGAAHPTATTSSVVFYASTPGAFVDLSAAAHRPNPGAVVLDVHLDNPQGAHPVTGSTGLPQAAIINQAIGVLLARGRTPQQARAALDARAVKTGLSVVATARAVLATTLPGHAEHDPAAD